MNRLRCLCIYTDINTPWPLPRKTRLSCCGGFWLCVCVYVREYSFAILCILTSLQPASMHECVCVCVCSVQVPCTLTWSTQFESEPFTGHPYSSPCLPFVSPSNDRTIGTAAHDQCIVFYWSVLDTIASCNIKLYTCDAVLGQCRIKAKEA